jgi:deoxycytidylate deaminase
MPQTLTGHAAAQALVWLEAAAAAAQASPCHRRKCGSVLVSAAGEVFGAAVNQPPPGAAVHCTPYCLPAGFKSDKACCVHAEQRSILNALQSGQSVQGSTMVFASVDAAGQRLKSGQPYCTICSKMALENGVEFWILEHESGIVQYGAAEYNRISFEYNGS